MKNLSNLGMFTLRYILVAILTCIMIDAHQPYRAWLMTLIVVYMGYSIVRLLKGEEKE